MKNDHSCEKDRLYTISQVAKTCGISRSTILRMEKDNLGYRRKRMPITITDITTFLMFSRSSRSII